MSEFCPCCFAQNGDGCCACPVADRADYGVARDFLNASASPKITAREERQSLVALLRGVRLREREECVKLCESLRSGVKWGAGKGVGNVVWDNARGICADAIRARGALALETRAVLK